ncbi:fatty acid desaturase family protein [Zavarzinia sp. CC-PAN008]|uniref:fatty acid desaturase family protein n=1 Tax=Zavarzinia sp. CC-PAN008 TaxID=3243332 RepID=UPI003F74AD2A
MNAARIAARDLVDQDTLHRVRRRSTAWGLFLVAHCWAVILAAVALVVWLPNPLTWLLAVAVIGSRQLGLAILVHEGAHGGLATDERLNLFVSQWFCAYPMGQETLAYRRYHLKHHARTQQKDDPDLVLSAPFPITRKSLRRKLLRDLSGQTGYQQRKAQIVNALGDPSWPLAKRARHYWAKLGRATAVNAGLFAAAIASGHWWVYPLLWLVPMLTWFQVVVRIRNIAEHAVLPENGATNPFHCARTTVANWLERAFLAPYFVNYHLEHHLMFYVPCYHLPALHRALMAGPNGPAMTVAHGYPGVLALATSRPANEDAPGALVHNARRKVANSGPVDEDSISSF